MANVAITADKYDQPLLLEQVKIEFGKLTNNTNAYMYDTGEERVKDLIKALSKLHSHDGGSKGIQDLQIMILYILKNSQQLRNMGTDIADVLETAVAEDVRLATLIVKYLAGGTCFDSPVIRIDWVTTKHYWTLYGLWVPWFSDDELSVHCDDRWLERYVPTSWYS